MDKEQIEKAANNYIECLLEEEIDYTLIDDEETTYETGKCDALSRFGKDIFTAGADWRINSVWHDNSEEPNLKDLVIVLTPNGGIFDFGFWEAKDKIREWQLWARMYDLIPCVLELDRLKVREKILSEEIIIDKLNINDTDNGRQRK